MKYKVSDNLKKESIRKYRIFMNAYYLMGIGAFTFPLFNRFSQLAIEIKVCIFIWPLFFAIAWWYFDKEFRKKMSVEYELTDDALQIFENGITTMTLNRETIKKIEAMASGYSVRHSKGSFLILNEVEELQQLVNQLERKTNRNTSS